MNEKAAELKNKQTPYTFDDLCQIMELLRGEGGCPWDREQNHKSIRKNLIEETYEVVEAIDNEDNILMREELGDFILQAVFHAQIAKEENAFDIGDVCNDICSKLIIRHPHIFASTVASTSAEVLNNWDAIKTVTKAQKSVTEKLHSIPPSLPALMRAYKAGEKAAKVNFDFVSDKQALEKLEEEINEFSEAAGNGNFKEMQDELGDILFSAVNVARRYGIEPEEALNASTSKFIKRFASLESRVRDMGKSMSELSMEQLDSLWETYKHTN